MTKIKIYIKLIVIIFIFFLSFFLVSKMYKTNSSVLDMFISSIERENYIATYQLFDNRMRKKYTLNEYIFMLKEIKSNNECFHYSKSRVLSSDNFNIFIVDCNDKYILFKISFSKKITNLKITNIVLNENIND